MKEYVFMRVSKREVTEIKKIYGEEDNGHSWPHITDVLNSAAEICKRLKMDVNNIIEYACLYHDISLPLGMPRKNHHMDGAREFIKRHPDMDKDTCEAIAQCIREHRSSVGGCSTLNSEIVASADNGIPATTLNNVLDKLIMRSVRHHTHTENEGVDEAIENAISHIMDKYGSHGYCEYPTLYIKLFSKELTEQTRIVDDLRSHEDYIYSYVKSHI